MRLLHAEVIQEDDPWRRCVELLDQYGVRVCAVEALPNYNEAHRFAKARDFGTERMLLVEPILRPAATPPAAAVAYAEQLCGDLPVPFESSARSVTCNDCMYFDRAGRWCGACEFRTRPELPSCDYFVARLVGSAP
jgi:hypothetical protein